MRSLRFATVFALAALHSGCFQTQSLIRLNADGSGTVEETVLMNSTMAMAVMAGGMGAMMGGGMNSGAMEMSDGPYDMAALEARAEAMGATLQGVEPIEILFGGGYTATYAFTDINDLRLDSDPSSALPSELTDEMGGGMGQPTPESITFEYSNQRLAIRIPQTAPEPVDEEIVMAGMEQGSYADDPKKYSMSMENEGPGEDEFRQMAVVLKDMRFSLAMELPREVAETNSSFVEGRTLTLFDMDFGALAESPDGFEALSALDMDSGPPSFQAGSMAALQGVPGIRVEPEETVTVTFR